jgi:hypothetical protein
MSEDITRGLPADLASVLRDQSVVVPQDAAVFELIAAWTKAPSMTASADISSGPDTGMPLRDVQDSARHADPRTTRRYDRDRRSLNRHAALRLAELGDE